MAFEVSTGDIEALWRPLDDDEGDVAFARLEQAQRLLRVKRPELETQMAALVTANAALPAGPAKTKAESRYADLVGTIRDVLSQVVIRYLQNPDRLRQQSIGASGDIGIGYDVGGREAAGGVYFTDADLASIDSALAVAGGTATSTVGSQQLETTFPYYRSPTSDQHVIN